MWDQGRPFQAEEVAGAEKERERAQQMGIGRGRGEAGYDFTCYFRSWLLF